MKIDESTIDHNVLLAIKGVTENMADILSDSNLKVAVIVLLSLFNFVYRDSAIATKS